MPKQNVRKPKYSISPAIARALMEIDALVYELCEMMGEGISTKKGEK